MGMNNRRHTDTSLMIRMWLKQKRASNGPTVPRLPMDSMRHNSVAQPRQHQLGRCICLARHVLSTQISTRNASLMPISKCVNNVPNQTGHRRTRTLLLGQAGTIAIIVSHCDRIVVPQQPRRGCGTARNCKGTAGRTSYASVRWARYPRARDCYGPTRPGVPDIMLSLPQKKLMREIDRRALPS